MSHLGMLLGTCNHKECFMSMANIFAQLTDYSKTQGIWLEKRAPDYCYIVITEYCYIMYILLLLSLIWSNFITIIQMHGIILIINLHIEYCSLSNAIMAFEWQLHAQSFFVRLWTPANNLYFKITNATLISYCFVSHLQYK